MEIELRGLYGFVTRRILAHERKSSHSRREPIDMEDAGIRELGFISKASILSPSPSRTYQTGNSLIYLPE